MTQLQHSTVDVDKLKPNFRKCALVVIFSSLALNYLWKHIFSMNKTLAEIFKIFENLTLSKSHKK